MNNLDVEIIIMDYAEELKIVNAKQLDWFSENMHQVIENALCDYAEDHDISDYEPNY